MIIVANGGYRTGSTLVYIIAQKILEYNNIEFESKVLSIEQIPELDINKNYVIKSHNWIPDFSDIKTIYTRRNCLDVYASFIKSGITVLDPVIEILEEQRRERVMLDCECLPLDYSDFYNNEKFAIKRISEYLGLIVDIDYIYNTVKKEKIMDLGKEELMHNHISNNGCPGNFVECLTHDEIKKVAYSYMEFYQ